jgi:glycine betaine transporter
LNYLYFKIRTSFLVYFIIIAILVILIALYPRIVFRYLNLISIGIRNIFGQFYLILGLIFVIFTLSIAILPFGKMRLGTSKPAFSFWSWVAMLYSAGMGAGILFRAVQEPVYMFQNPPIDTSASSKIIALEYTFFQWGFTAWAFYTVFALVIGHLIFNLKKPVQLSYLFTKAKTNFWANSVNSLTLLTTIIGIVSATALGAKQIQESAEILMPLPNSFLPVLIIVLVVFLCGTVSSLLGLDKGIKRLSNFNILLTTLLLLFVFFQGDVVLILKDFVTSFWYYIKDFIQLSLALGEHDPGKQFLTDWTYYYWAFWLAWAPFTGVFIARISRGRTIRQIVLGSVFIPAIASFFWFSVFGSSAIGMIEQNLIDAGELNSAFDALSVFLGMLHWPEFTQVVVLVLLFGFLITSLDSGLFVLSMFSDHGKTNPANSHKVVWAIVCILLSLAFLILGHALPEQNVLSAVSKILIIFSLPFAFLSVLIIFRFTRELVWKKNNGNDS